MAIMLTIWLLIQLLQVIRSNDRSTFGIILTLLAVLGILLWLLQCTMGFNVPACLSGAH